MGGRRLPAVELDDVERADLKALTSRRKTGQALALRARIVLACAQGGENREVAARLALSSRHPLATAVAREARIRTPIDGAVEEPGRGVRAVIDGTEARLGSPEFCNVAKGPHNSVDGGSVIMFSHAGRTATLSVRQKLRPDAKEVIAGLKARHVDLAILSGDRREAVAPVAKTLGIASAISGLNPAEKIAAIEQIKANGHRVLMVGDGINDAPALACADVSLSPISAAHITQAHADAVFLGDRLQPVSDAIDIARRASFLMKQNLWLALLYNAIAVRCYFRACHTADRGGGHVGLLDPGHFECIARPTEGPGGAVTTRRSRYSDFRRENTMNVLIYLVPMALALGLTGLAAFLWSLRSGQYDDMDGASIRVLSDDDVQDCM